MGYCPRCGENTNLGTGPNIVSERRQPLRISASSNIVHIDGANDSIHYGGMRFKVERDGDQLLLWAIE
ncbi:MAG: hypothetical protein WBW04_11485 [Nitrolancea sp.]